MADGAYALVRAIRLKLAPHFTRWAVQPYILCWESRPWASATFSGARVSVTLALAGVSGTEPSEMTAAHDRAIELLHDADLDIPGHVLIDLQFQNSQAHDCEPGDAPVRQMTFQALVIEDSLVPTPSGREATY